MFAEPTPVELYDVGALLVRAEFVLRRRNRADCAHCEGRSRGTTRMLAWGAADG